MTTTPPRATQMSLFDKDDSKFDTFVFNPAKKIGIKVRDVQRAPVCRRIDIYTIETIVTA